MTHTIYHKFFLFACTALLLAGCGITNPFKGGEEKFPTTENRQAHQNKIYEKPESIFGKGGILGEQKKQSAGITVNAYLWRAALDTVSFMPLTSVDPFGGVILTDWYTAPESPNERYKLNIFIIGSQLRSDALRVTMFKQVRAGKGWADQKVQKAAETQIEDAILTRARELRVTGLPEAK